METKTMETRMYEMEEDIKAIKAALGISHGEHVEPINSSAVKRSSHIKQDVTEYLKKMGVPASIKGYQYLREAIMIAVGDIDVIDHITKGLYPQVANTFHTTAARVERAIRHAVEVAWDRGDLDTLNEFFGYSVSSTKGKPTNSEFISAVADYFILKEANNEMG